MKQLIMLLCAAIPVCAMMTGCMQKTVDDVSEAASTAISDIEDRADEYGTVNDGDGSIKEDTSAVLPTMADLDEMIDNGVIDDENNVDDDGDNIDDDKLKEDAPQDDAADGGDHNAETMDNNGSDFI